jgi:type VI secretion system protein ImpL
MGYFGFYIVSAIVMALFIGASWICTSLLHLSGFTEMIVRMLLIGAVFMVFGLVYWLRQKKQRRKQTEAERQQAEVAAEEREIESFVRDAEVRLAASAIGKEAKLSSLPIYFLIGETGAAKTSLFVHSGVEPELLAGQVYQDANLVPTRPVNIWLAQKSVFVEAGGRLLAEPGRWMRLVKRLQPPKRRLFGGEQPPRGVIVAFDCESFLKPGGDDALAATARNLHARLGEISQVLGIRLPVYVLFSKLDRLGFFSEFVGNLTDEEVHQTLGVTLPLHDTRDGGVYAEQESRRLTAAFEGLFHAMCHKRLPFLARENDGSRLPAVYEFPREFRKLRDSAVRLLVDLGRPSQLRVNPFLRGFYFSGVRPIVVKESMPSARASAAPAPRPKRGATGFFDSDMLNDAMGASPLGSGGAVRTRRTPQWLFLGHLFSDVILRDRTALGASAQSVRAEMARRVLAGVGAALLAIWSIGMTVSYFRNRGLESRVDEAARGIARSESGGGGQELPSRDSLERLDTLRDTVEQLSLYEREGAPWSLRWGLYVGSDMYPTARSLYFNRFKQLLFGSTQLSLLEWLRKLPGKPGPADEYKPTYDTLKAYLMTTSHHEKSTRDFLSPLLYERWAAGRQIDPDRAALARRQFDFYSDELAIANPFSSNNDGEAVEWARSYLAQFNAVERIYQFILAEATRQKPSINFNRQYKGSGAYVVNNHDVSGAFSVDGWKFVDDAINNIRRFFGGEEWVLGPHALANVDPQALGPQLRDRYHQDFIANWRAYLAASEVVPYRNVADAAQKLGQLSSNQSYLLGLLCLASVNIEAGSQDVKDPYQPVQYVTPASCTDRYIQDHNNAYAAALVSLQASMDRVARSGTGVKDDEVSQTEADATNAYKVTRQIAQNFRIDREGNVHGMVQKIMEDPIRYAEAVLGRLGPAQLNAEGQRLCSEFGGLAHKYPFDTNSKTDATLSEIDNIFRPEDGRLAAFYESTLKNYVERRNGEFVRKTDSRVQITDAFLRFLNRATALSDALYKNGAKSPSLTYNMKAQPAEGLNSLTLTLDGQVLKSSGAGGESKDFVWPGPAHNATMAGSMGGPELGFVTTDDSLWAVFRFFADADRFQSTNAGYSLQWVPRQGQAQQPIRIAGKALTLPFLLDLKGAPPIFQKGYLSGFQCVSEVAR